MFRIDQSKARTDAAPRVSRVLTAGLCIHSSKQPSESRVFFVCVCLNIVQFSASCELSLMRSQDVRTMRRGRM